MAEQQTWLSHEVTPSGIEIRFGVEPKRLYQVRKSAKGQWKDAPSVTEVLGVLDKPALVVWGQRIGIEGCLHLIREGLIGRVNGEPVPGDVAGVEALLSSEKISVHHTRDKAADRGKSVHDALELWAKHWSPLGADLPAPSFFPESEQGYIRGLVEFLVATNAEPIAAEIMVGSVKHGYAGRVDLRMRVPEDCEVVFHRTPARGPQTKILPAGVYMADLKTSKSVYSSHSRQLEAYETASVECGHEPTDGRGVIHVTADGNYAWVQSWAEFSDFLAVLKVWKSDADMKVRRKAA